MSLTRDDMLRELELLPVWRLRTPLANDVVCVTTPNVTPLAASIDALVAQATSFASAAKKVDNTNLIQGIHQRGYLPHLKAEGGIYAVTFRLHDSLPANVLAQMDDLAANNKNEILEEQLNTGHGECLLVQPVIAEMLKQVLLAKHNQDYYLHAWVIMPNHVHLLVEPLSDCVLSDILQAIKSISAHYANQLLGREGAFWQRESYDHLVRDEDGFNHALEYIIQNPVKANLVKLSDEYAFGSAFAGEGACATTSTTTPTTTPTTTAGAASKDALVAQAPSPAGAESSNDLVAQATSFASLTPIQQLLTCSADKKWAFIWPASLDLSASQSILFSNILNALKIDKTNKNVLASLVVVDAKVIIAMGEIAAQQLLNTQDSLEQLRGKPHLMHNIPLIVTYHPSDCLKYLPNKAKVWDDLCVALSIINA